MLYVGSAYYATLAIPKVNLIIIYMEQELNTGRQEDHLDRK
jgi:hypothetical protein